MKVAYEIYEQNGKSDFKFPIVFYISMFVSASDFVTVVCLPKRRRRYLFRTSAAAAAAAMTKQTTDIFGLEKHKNSLI